MKERAILKALFFFVFVGLLVIGICDFEMVSANFAWIPEATPPTPTYITEDGSIQGGTGTLQRMGDIYILTRDTSETFEIQKSNITFDGNECKINTPEIENQSWYENSFSFYPAIKAVNCNNITIKNVRFDDCHTCIRVENSTEVLIVQNQIINSNIGLSMEFCSNSTITNNELTNHKFGLFLKSSFKITIQQNNISYNDWHGGWISIDNSNITRNNIVNNTNIGLYLYGPNSGNHFSENNFIDNEVGLGYMNTQSGLCTNNSVYNNYWNNLREDIMNAESTDALDQSQAKEAFMILTEKPNEPSPYPSLTQQSTETPNIQPTNSATPYQTSTPPKTETQTTSPSPITIGIETHDQTQIIVILGLSVAVVVLVMVYLNKRK